MKRLMETSECSILNKERHDHSSLFSRLQGIPTFPPVFLTEKFLFNHSLIKALILKDQMCVCIYLYDN